MYDSITGEEVGCITAARRSVIANVVGAAMMFGGVENIIHGGDLSPIEPAVMSVAASISTVALCGANLIESVVSRIRR